MNHGISLGCRLQGTARARHQKSSTNLVGGSGHHDGSVSAKVVRIDAMENIAVTQLLFDVTGHRTRSTGHSQVFGLGDDAASETEFCPNLNVVQAFDAVRIPKVIHDL